MRRTGLNPLSQVLEETLSRLDLQEAALEARAVMLWSEIVGRQMAKASEARRVLDGTLYVTVRNTGWSQELSFQKPLLLRRFRERLGSEFVKDFRFSVGVVRGAAASPETEAPPEEEIRRVRLAEGELQEIRDAVSGADPELAAAIRRALTHEAQVRRWKLVHGARACSKCGAAHRAKQDLCPACLVG